MGLQWVILHEIQRVQAQPISDFAVLLSFLGNYSTYMYLTALVMWWNGQIQGQKLGLLVFATMGFTDIVKTAVHTTRPIGVPGILSKYTESAAGASFPSGHTMVSTVYYVTIARYVRRIWRILLLFVPVAIGMSRLYLGVHWPIDVFAGWVLGITIAFLPLSNAVLWPLILLLLTFTPLVQDTSSFGRFIATCWLLFALWPWPKQGPKVRKLVVGTALFAGLVSLTLVVPYAIWWLPFASGAIVHLVGKMV